MRAVSTKCQFLRSSTPFVEECKFKRIDEESYGKAVRRRMVQKYILWHYHFVGYELKY